MAAVLSRIMIGFGPFAFDEARGLLLRQGEPLALGNRALALLAAPGRTEPPALRSESPV